MKEISRRDFLGLSGAVVLAAAGGWGLGKLAVRAIESSNAPEPSPLTPLNFDGVEVYGLKEKISTTEDVRGFYSYLDRQYEEKHGVKITNKVSQRKELLDPNERYLEVVVRQSAFDSFTQKERQTGVNFPEWIMMSVDVANRCMKNAEPPADMKVVLRRILVIDDNLAKNFWDEKAFREGKGGALDLAWRNKFSFDYPFDTDQSWAIADDYRNRRGYFWEVRHDNGKTIIGSPPGKGQFDQFYEFPEENDSLAGKNKVSFDMGLDHEWMHYLLTLPDEYVQDVHDSSQRFKDFVFGTGSFEWPYFSPYISYLTRMVISLKERGMTSRINESFYDRPKEINMGVWFNDQAGIQTEIRRVRLVDGNLTGPKTVPEEADEISDGGSIIFRDYLFQGRSNCWLMKVNNGSVSREVFLPAAAFNMTKIAGLDSVNYNLVFNGYDDTEKTGQEVVLIQDSKIDEYLKNSQDIPYAKMKVEGTNTWFVWFLR